LQAELFDPSGNPVFNVTSSTSAGPFALTQSGTYRLVLSGFAGTVTTGSYSFSMLKPLTTTTPFTPNTPITHSLANPPHPPIPGPPLNPWAQAIYTFTAAAGQPLPSDPTPRASNRLQAQLFDPSGNPVFDTNGSTDQGPITLTQSGTYRLLLSSSSGATGTYS